MFGGGDNSVYHADTWEYDGTDWTKRSTSVAPSLRWGHTLTYHPYRETVVLFGGRLRNSYYNDTWEWDGQRWLKIAPAGTPPSTRQAHGVAFDMIAIRMVLFGGQGTGTSNGTWLYGSGRISARFATVGKGCGPAPVCKLAAAPGSLPLLGKKFTLITSNLPTSATSALMTIGLKKTTPVNLAPYGLPGCFLYHSLDLILGFPVSAGAGQFSGTIPNQPATLRTKVYVQVAAGTVVSNAGEIRVGDQ